MDFNAKTSGNFVLYAILTLSSNVRFSLVTETSYSPAYFDYKLIFSLCDALRDITEKKSTEEKVQEENEVNNLSD
jgi:hypothetical protein